MHTEGMPSRWSPAWLLHLGLLLSCGGLRGESPRVEPSGVADLTRGGRVQAQAAQPSAPVVTENVAPPSAADVTPEKVAPEDDATRIAREYPLHGVAFHMLAQVFVAPGPEAVVRGYLRRGSPVRVKPGVRAKGCDGLWHEVLGGGFACATRGFLIGKTPQTWSPSPVAANVHEDLPYAYGKVMGKDVAQYFRVPTPLEERDVAGAIAQENAAARAASAKMPSQGETHAVLAKASADKKSAIAPVEAATPFPSLLRMVMQPGFYVSLDGQEENEGRNLARTVRGAYVRAEALTEVTPPTFGGTHIGPDTHLPLGLVYRAGVPSYRRDALTGELVRAEPLALMQSFSLTEESVLQSGRRYRLTREGLFVPEDALRIVNKMPRPPLVAASARWLDIQLSTQTLVAYEGNTPVFATLVSTGKEGYETKTGIFRIQDKHVSTTMDGEMGTDEAYSIEDVPWTMYFAGSLALHAAFWHKGFGRVRSHGCVNLAPRDARHLFQWTTPSLPAGFHGVYASRADLGTFVVINP